MSQIETNYDRQPHTKIGEGVQVLLCLHALITAEQTQLIEVGKHALTQKGALRKMLII